MKKLIAVLSFALLFLSGIVLYPKIAYASENGVVLDGYFDDWADKPATYLKYSWINDGQVNTVKWYTDSNYLYLYIGMGVHGYTNLGYNIIYFTVNDGSEQQMQLAPDSPQNGRISIYDVNGGYTLLSNDGYIVRGNSQNGSLGDRAEFKIPLTEFQKYNDNKMFTLKLRFPNLGEQSVIFQAGSTNPYLGVALCSMAFFPGYYIYRKKRKTA